MHPIHYSLLLGVLTLIGGFTLALVQGEPLVFVISLIVGYLLGAQTVGRFDRGPDDDPGYDGTPGAGFVDTNDS
jgi:hypothetical protein